MNKRLLLVAVNYNSWEETIQFVKSLSVLQDGIQMQVVIVENSKQEFRDKSLENTLRGYINNLAFVETPENKNYFGSVNFALKQLQLEPVDFDFFVISNVDIIIENPLFLSKILDYKKENIGIIAPSVFSMSQKIDQNPYIMQRFNRNYFYYYKILYSHVFLLRFHEALSNFLRRRIKVTAKETLSHSDFIYAPHGAFMIFLKKYFQLGGSVDYGDNLFGEEMFVAEECFKKGLRVIYEPELQVLHAEHVSTGTLTGKYAQKKKLDSIKYLSKNFT